jgi:transcriptional regulator with XRE-family HTH domain
LSLYRSAVETVADRLEKARKDLGISGRELSRRAGFAAESQYGVTLGRLKKNPESEVSLPVLKAIARGLGVSLSWLLTGEGKPTDQAPPDEGAPEVAAPSAAAGVWSARRAEAEQRAKERGLVIRWWAWDECLRMFVDHDPDDVPLEAMVQVAHALDGSNVGKPRGPQAVTGAHESTPAATDRAGGAKGG